MSFREKSAWGMAAVIAVTGLFYLWIVLQSPTAPVIGPLLPYVFAVVILSIVVQVALAISSGKQANEPADEREVVAIDRAGHWSGIALGLAVLLAAASYIVTGEGNILFHGVMLGMIVAQFTEYALQIVLFRRGV